MRKRIFKLLSGALLVAALLACSACKKAAKPLLEEGGLVALQFTVVSQTSGAPLEGIRMTDVSSGGMMGLGVSDDQGRIFAQIEYVRNWRGPFVRFEDPEGMFYQKDTLLADLRPRNITIEMVPAL